MYTLEDWRAIFRHNIVNMAVLPKGGFAPVEVTDVLFKGEGEFVIVGFIGVNNYAEHRQVNLAFKERDMSKINMETPQARMLKDRRGTVWFYEPIVRRNKARGIRRELSSCQRLSDGLRRDMFALDWTDRHYMAQQLYAPFKADEELLNRRLAMINQQPNYSGWVEQRVHNGAFPALFQHFNIIDKDMQGDILAMFDMVQYNGVNIQRLYDDFTVHGPAALGPLLHFAGHPLFFYKGKTAVFFGGEQIAEVHEGAAKLPERYERFEAALRAAGCKNVEVVRTTRQCGAQSHKPAAIPADVGILGDARGEIRAAWLNENGVGQA